MTQPSRLAARAAVTALLLSAATFGPGVAQAQTAPMVPAPRPSLEPSPAGAGVPLANTTWVLKRFGKNPVLSFNPDNVTAATGCNTLSGAYTVAVPNRVTITLDAGQTEPAAKGCSRGQQKASDKLANQLNRVTTYDLSSDGKTLTLRGEAGNLKFKRGSYDEAPQP